MGRGPGGRGEGAMVFWKKRPRNWDLTQYMATQKGRIEACLAQLPRQAGRTTKAHEAMRYALAIPGKRFRPLLTLATADIYQASHKQAVLDGAIAVECVHTASLLFDDLPCMDDAALRRGHKTTHLVYGEAQALLAGLSLIAEANLQLGGTRSSSRTELARRLECLTLLGDSFSVDGLSGGQSDDLLNRTELDMHELEYIHAKKTGSLFIASVEIAAVLCGATERERECLKNYAKNLGLAFQIQDDLLDLASSSQTGKDSGKDAGKTTFVNLAGAEKSVQLVDELFAVALSNLKPFGEAAFHLHELTTVIQKRSF